MNKITLNNGCQIDPDGSWPRKVWVEGKETFHLKQRCGGPWCVNKNHYVFESVAYEITFTKAELKRIAATSHTRVDKPTIAYVKSHIDEVWDYYKHIGSCEGLSAHYKVSKTFLNDYFASIGYRVERPTHAIQAIKAIVVKTDSRKQEHSIIYLASKYSRATPKDLAQNLGITEELVQQKLKASTLSSKIRDVAEQLYQENR